MHYNCRKLLQRRKDVRQALLEMGWKERQSRYPASNIKHLTPWACSPSVDDYGIGLEEDLKRINTSFEAHFRCETLALGISHIGWRSQRCNPHVKDPLDPNEAWFQVAHLLVRGIPFSYDDPMGKVRREKLIFVDWEHPERNTFSFVYNWSGLRNDGFAWDFVLMVNSIPVMGVVLAPDEPGKAPCETALEEANEQILADGCFRAYAHAMIVSNGEEWKYGMPLEEDLDELDPLLGDTLVKKLSSLLSPAAMLAYLYSNVDWVEADTTVYDTPYDPTMPILEEQLGDAEEHEAEDLWDEDEYKTEGQKDTRECAEGKEEQD